MLARLEALNPRAQHYGTDVSAAMVAATRVRCAKCAAVVQFDLATLLDADSTSRAGVQPLARGLPATFDVVVVSDVLYFMPFARLPPVAGRLVPKAWLRASQRRFFDALVRLARRAVVFSDHEDNPLVVDFLAAHGARRACARPPPRASAPTPPHRRARCVWTTDGRALQGTGAL